MSKSINRWFDLIDETQLYIIANSDLTMDYPKPLFPNVISVEGLSAVDAKPLPEGKWIKRNTGSVNFEECQSKRNPIFSLYLNKPRNCHITNDSGLFFQTWKNLFSPLNME